MRLRGRHAGARDYLEVAIFHFAMDMLITSLGVALFPDVDCHPSVPMLSELLDPPPLRSLRKGHGSSRKSRDASSKSRCAPGSSGLAAVDSWRADNPAHWDPAPMAGHPLGRNGSQFAYIIDFLENRTWFLALESRLRPCAQAQAVPVAPRAAHSRARSR